MAHARRKFHELWANHGSQVGEQALKFFGQLYRGSSARSQTPTADERRRLRQRKITTRWPTRCTSGCWQQRQQVPDGSATAKAIDYSLKRWAALTRYLDDGDVPIDNNWVENQIRPIALGRHELAVRRQPARGQAGRGGHEPGALGQAQRARSVRLPADVLERLPTQPASRIDELLPHRWQPADDRQLSSVAGVKMGSPDAYPFTAK